MVFKKGAKGIRGDKKSKAEIKKTQAEMFKLMCQGMSKASIITFSCNKYKIHESTARRYWNGIWDLVAEKYDAEGDKELMAFRARSKKRMEEAAHKYFKEGSNDWLKSWREEEYDYMKFMQSIGIIKKAPEDVNVNVTNETDKKLEELNAVLSKARDSISKEEKNHPSSK